MTPFDIRCEILGEIWFGYKQEESLADFISYNDLGLPLAYLIFQNMSEPTEKGTHFINETWDLLMKALEVEDGGEPFESFDDFEKLI